MKNWIGNLNNFLKYAYGISYATVLFFVYQKYVGIIDVSESPLLSYFFGMSYRTTLLIVVISVAHFLTREKQ